MVRELSDGHKRFLVKEANTGTVCEMWQFARDGSPEYLQEVFPDISVIANARNVGFAAGCNIGMKKALEELVGG